MGEGSYFIFFHITRKWKHQRVNDNGEKENKCHYGNKVYSISSQLFKVVRRRHFGILVPDASQFQFRWLTITKCCNVVFLWRKQFVWQPDWLITSAICSRQCFQNSCFHICQIALSRKKKNIYFVELKASTELPSFKLVGGIFDATLLMVPRLLKEGFRLKSSFNMFEGHSV